MDDQVFRKLYRWARFRHPRKNRGWCFDRYWRRQGNRNNFGDGTSWLARYADTPIVRHVKVRGDKSPYDGDWPYWVERLGRDLTKPTRVIRLLKRQKNRCALWAALRGRGHRGSASPGRRPDEQSVCQPGLAPRSLSRRNPRQRVPVTKALVLRSRMT